MIERLPNLPFGIDGFKAIGRLSREDYERTFAPLLQAAAPAGRRLRLLYQLGPEFQGFTPSGALSEAQLGLRAKDLLDGYAVVSDLDWIAQSARVAGYLLPCPVRVFPNAELPEAARWLSALPQSPVVSQHMITDAGVLVIDLDQALRMQDFDEVERTLDVWIETHGQLSGLVLHARRFPGWQNVNSLLRQARFVREHRRMIKRVALAMAMDTDGSAVRMAAPLLELLLLAETRRFRFDELEAATRWAGAAGNSEGAAAASQTASDSAQPAG